MEFSIRQDIGATVTEVEDRLSDGEFIAATGALAPLADCRLLDLRTTDHGFEARVHRRFAAQLPRVVTAVVDPGKLTWVEEVSFDRRTHTGEHRIVPEHYRDLLRCTYRTTLEPDGDGTRRHVRGQLRVRVLVGGRQVERAIVEGLEDYAHAEAALLESWGSRPPARPA